jgi:hypothetical protein
MIGRHLEIVLVITGAFTVIAILQFIVPAAMLRTIFGDAPKDAASLALARHWGLLMFLIGVLLIYAALHHVVREPAVVLVAIEKVALGVVVLGTSLRYRPAAAAIAIGDRIIVFISILYLGGY